MTASTEHPLGPGHLDGALSLTRAAHWNQNEADWRLMLAIGRGWGITVADGVLAASTVVLPYGARFAWVSMVLVDPAHRRKGYASRLLRVAIADLEKRGLTPILDATPAGHEVYVQEGFHDTWGFKRYALASPPAPATAPAGVAVRPLEARDWPQVLALDAHAFGASREALLRALAGRQPAAALVAEANGAFAGFLLGRDGHEAAQLGPLVTGRADVAEALLARALAQVPAPLYVDVADHAPAARAWLEAQGFAFQRPFTRMVHGTGGAPGDASTVVLVAGPELG